ncbi:hypothetical protein M405DRAFT_830180 [Rhizopogon salebrosus TDB-379]|nr:hypothetical protein M405DRAFT_830180 [Rhizopogon salebrosus TDB-379]
MPEGHELFTDQESDTSKCQLWDDLAKRHANEVEAAAKKATEEVQREEKIKTEIVTSSCEQIPVTSANQTTTARP